MNQWSNDRWAENVVTGCILVVGGEVLTMKNGDVAIVGELGPIHVASIADLDIGSEEWSRMTELIETAFDFGIYEASRKIAENDFRSPQSRVHVEPMAQIWSKLQPET